MSTNDETDVAQRMEQAIRRYYAACNTGDVEAVAAFFAPGAVHYVPPGYGGSPRGGRAIGEVIARLVQATASRWSIDQVVCDPGSNRAVIEWTVRRTGALARGAEWYEFDQVIAGIVPGEAGDVSRFRDRDHVAACNGTAPVEVSSGNRTVHRLSRRGNRRVNHAVHMAAITQIRHRHSEGRACCDKKIAEGKTSKEAVRALKRRISDAICRRLRVGARRVVSQSAQVTGPGGQAGNVTDASAADSHPGCRLFGTATPGPEPTLRPDQAAQPKKRSSQASKR